MTNPYFVNTLDLIAGNKARASEVEANLSAVQAGFDGVNTDVQSLQTLKAPLASPAFTGTPTAPTAASGTSTAQLASTLFVQNAIAAAAALSLPTVAGNAGKFLQTDGTTVAWGSAVNKAGDTGIGSLTMIGDLTVPNVSVSASLSAPTVTVTGLLDYDDTVLLVSTPTTATKSRTYVLTATTTLTLPAAPSAGDWVRVVNRSATVTPVVARNGQNLMGLAEDMTINTLHASFKLVFADATRGWVLA